MRFHSYLSSAAQILNEYNGDEPFALFLKKYFSQNKKYGSKDRKQIGHLCYCYFRLGKSLLELPVEERILAALFLCSKETNEILEQIKPEWNNNIGKSLDEKFSMLNAQRSILNVFPWKEELSEEIDYEKFCGSFFTQPDLFLRLRPGYENSVKEKLRSEKISFKEIDSNCLSLSNASKIENIIELDNEAVIQDYSSQQTKEYFKLAIDNCSRFAGPIVVWDCCAGSGGKSLLLHDIKPNLDLTVSDIRESILMNLKKRFARAGIRKYRSFVTDLTTRRLAGQAIHPSATRNYDLIICDAPCTGSGTWSRTPEQLYFFDENLPAAPSLKLQQSKAGQAGKIDQYACLQKKIVSNIIPYLNENGFLVYITCSVFKKENEEVVNYIRQEFDLELTNMELLKGYDKKADTMFVSLLRKNL